MSGRSPSRLSRSLTEDLLAGIEAPGPVLRTFARRVARLLQRIDQYEYLVDRVPHVAGHGVDFLELQARVAARRDGDDLAVQRGLAALDTLRARHTAVQATMIRQRPRRRGGRR